MILLETGAGCANKETCAGLKSAGGTGEGSRVERGEPAACAADHGRPLPPVACACVFR
jgi:hypothetical protein